VSQSLQQVQPPPNLSVNEQEELLKLVDHNNNLFRSAIGALDAAVQAMSLVINAIVAGESVQKTPAGAVDYNYYIARHEAALKADAVPSPILAATDEDVIIFGGTDK
jgi:hypothetical protein